MGEKRIPGPIVKSEAIFAVADVAATIRFYREKLGFTKTWVWDDPPTHGGVEWGGISLMFHLDADLAQYLEGHQHYFFVKGFARRMRQR
jgi:catechol 2,3-dioxygenase-like lactoylglutathione lyase family enzyme